MSSFDKLVWEQKYRPSKVDDCILPTQTKNMVKDFIGSGTIPNLLFSGSGGIGKTTLAKAIANEMDSELLYINASLEGNMDMIRTTLTQFVSTVSLEDRRKVVLLDECLSENETVRVGTIDNWEPIALKTLQLGVEYPIVSYNIETGELENDIGSIISDREDDLYEVLLESGKTIIANSKHPFMCKDSTGNTALRTIEEGFDGYTIICV